MDSSKIVLIHAQYHGRFEKKHVLTKLNWWNVLVLEREREMRSKSKRKLVWNQKILSIVVLIAMVKFFYVRINGYGCFAGLQEMSDQY